MLQESKIMWVVLVLMVGLLTGCSQADTSMELPLVKVYKSPTCGCCNKWIGHLENNGFSVKAIDVPDVSNIKDWLGVPKHLSSCHTAQIGNYVIEGHVPAQDIIRLLKEQQAVGGLAVPGMPQGSPGMESPNPEAYDVIAFGMNGNGKIFSSHSP